MDVPEFCSSAISTDHATTNEPRRKSKMEQTIEPTVSFSLLQQGRKSQIDRTKFPKSLLSKEDIPPTF
jgi:hypothetical protein